MSSGKLLPAIEASVASSSSSVHSLASTTGVSDGVGSAVGASVAVATGLSVGSLDPEGPHPANAMASSEETTRAGTTRLVFMATRLNPVY